MATRRRSPRAFILLLITALVGSALALAPVREEPASAAPVFDDVPAGTWYSDAVGWLADAAITTGTSPTTFSPDDPVTRAQMAAFIARYLQTEGIAGDHGFGDVVSGSYYDAAVSVLVDRGITTGTSATTYSPTDVVSRKQMAAFLYRLRGEPATSAPNPFTDNPAGTYFHDAVRWLAAEGITTGTTDTTYSPDDVVSRKQMATFLWRLAGEPTAGVAGTNRVDTETTVQAVETDVQFTHLSESGESEIEWTGEEKPELGDIVVMDATDETPDGFLGKVTAVGGDTVITRPAVLQEVVEDGEFVVDMTLEENQAGALSLQAALQDVFDSADMSCGGAAGVEVSAGMGVEPNLTLSGAWSLADGVEAEIGFSVTVTANITALAHGEVSCSASISSTPKKLRAIKFWVGSIPVWIDPEISFFGEISANFSAYGEISYDWSETVGVSVSYAQGEWDVKYQSPGGNSPTLTPTFHGEAVLDIELGARLDMLVYGRGGPYATLGPFFQITAQIDDPWWAVDAGLRASVGASFDLWFWEGEVQFAEVDLLRYRLADANQSSSPFPDDVPGGFTAPGIAQTSDIATGGAATCVVIAGIVQCVGLNDEAQLGDPSMTNRPSLWPHGREYVGNNSSNAPQNAIELQMESNSFTQGCALYDDGTLRCWGTVPMTGWAGSFWHQPRTVNVPQPVRNFSISSNSGCAVTEDFTAWCWGAEYVSESSSKPYTDPTQIAGLTSIVDTAVTGGTRCAVHADGTVSCWGNNSKGQLGNGTGDGTLTPTLVDGLTNVKMMDGGRTNMCAVHYDGAVSCWGAGDYAQLGNGEHGTFAHESTPQLVAGITDAVDVEMGALQTCVIHETGDLSCWGYDPDYQLGPLAGPWVTSPRLMVDVGPDEPQIVGVDVGQNSICVQLSDNTSKCWGLNQYGQLGDNGTTNSATPRTVRNAPLP